MLNLQGASYIHANGDLLFSDLNLSINKHEKIALIGHNGAGKSTLLKILAGKLMPTGGHVKTESTPYYVPQLFGQFNDFTVAQALRIEDKLKALNEILNGEVTDENMFTLNDDWGIEERCAEALSYWRLEDLDLDQKIESLSGGQKTSVFLAGTTIHRPDIVLLDEPTNHLDLEGRNRLYDYIRSTRATLLIVSHDRTLLSQIEKVCELSSRGITLYGGNYDFYAAQKKIENEALNHDLKAKEKALRKAKEVEKESLERQQKLDARGKKKQEKAGLPTISMNTLKNNAEKSTAKLKGVHAEKLDHISAELSQLRSALPDADKMKIGFDQATLHKGKSIVEAKELNYAFRNHFIWKEPISFQVFSGERYVIKGRNGSGKTTLIKLILGQLQPSMGSLNRADINSMYIDQDYSLIDNQLTVYEQAQQYNSGVLQEHEIKTRLNRFLFGKTDWDKTCSALSGGEKMRLILCSLTISNQSPDLMILDEPTNNLDIQNIEILTAAINGYQGTLLVISHDEYFLDQVKVEHTIHL
ncbi:ABC-F family ATP-binding cassette domain-containing protein [Pedobacter sp. KBS0701]|uniref:ribosomal protection-like ABC-F family protein n=1 Tax=Pedobacter sp. KBS0701 TaxID=2578106 RepID=UPI00110D4894|nr:ABC-F family ATP-binding cassette domain-containing protein [Pedobacter sp. KBS0701]QDW27129.1 ABC-F family ATP-binding cassette domain-containing protein [Pedobacter sp. KBS0701]